MKLGVFMLWTEMRVAPPDALAFASMAEPLPATLTWDRPAATTTGTAPVSPAASSPAASSPILRRGESASRSAARPLKTPRRKKSFAIADADSTAG